MTGKRTPDVASFLAARSARNPENGCLEWTSQLTPKGYGRINKQGSGSVLAHRASYLVSVGPIPDGMCVCHRCDNRKCIEPTHLFLGSHEDNVADRQAKQRQFKKYDDALIAAIRRRAKAGEPQHALASEYGLPPGYVSQLVSYTKRKNSRDTHESA